MHLIHNVNLLLAIDLLQKLSISCKLFHNTCHTLDIGTQYNDRRT